MLITTFDKEVQSRINFFQKEYNCAILIIEKDGYFYMTVSFTHDDGWELVQDIKLTSTDANKCKFMNTMRAYFKSR